MKMFPKNRKAIFNIVDDVKVTVRDFRLRSTRCGFESYRTVDYKVYPKFSEEEMFPKIDAHLEKLFQGEIDESNGDVLDSFLIAIYRESLSFLNREKYEHMDIIKRLSVRFRADEADLKRIVDERKAECVFLEEEYASICQKIDERKEKLYEKRRGRNLKTQ